MKILSVDVGIKNLAFCLLEYIENDEENSSLNTFNIILWDVLNLCDDKKSCDIDNCNSDAKYLDENSNDTYLCLKHCKKYKLTVLPKEFNEKTLKKIKLEEIKELINKYNITIESFNNTNNNQNKIKYTKNDYLKNINKFIDLNYLKPVKVTNANDVDLISIGIKIKKKLDLIFFNSENNIGHDIDLVLIENQISPIANRMKTIQGMISQYFIMKDITNIIYYSASNKLKQFIDDKTDYKERKALSVQYTKQILNRDNNGNNNDNNTLTKWQQFFILHKKKDDLADSFLQGLSYMNTNLNFNTMDAF